MTDVNKMTPTEVVKEIADSFIPGFYLGCTLRIKNHPVSSHIGKTFVSTTDVDLLRKQLFDFRRGIAHYVIDPNNTYQTNYTYGNLEVVKPEFRPVGQMLLVDIAKEISTYIPGYYIGCTFKIINASGGWIRHVGKTFASSTTKTNLEHVLHALRNGSNTSGYDPRNTYGINYRLGDLEVVPASTGASKFRMKTEKELINEFGSFAKVPGYVTVSMKPYLGLTLTQDFYNVLSNSPSGRADSGPEGFIGGDQIPNRDRWTFSMEMITDAPLPTSVLSLEPGPGVLYSGPAYVVAAGPYTLETKDDYDDLGKTKEEPDQQEVFISDFVTTQLHIKKKKVKLSIN